MSAPVWLIILLLAGCGSPGGKTDEVYKSSRSVKSLEAPPEIILPDKDPAYTIPAISKSAAAPVKASPPGSRDGQTGNSKAAIRIQRDGELRWLMVDGATPESLWKPLLGFWKDQGVKLEEADARQGVMKTGWINDRDSQAADRGEEVVLRDQYRLRIERSDTGSNIYLTHKGVEKVAGGDTAPEGWKPRPLDTEREARMLARLRLHLARR